MKIVIASDSYKGTLNQYEVAEIVIDELKALGHTGVMKPMSDGGDGLLHCFRNEKYDRITANVTGPEGNTVEADYYMKDGTAIIETAEACGLHLVTDSKPEDRTSFGVGELLLSAVDNGASDIIMGLGGSATNDGGYGMFMALGGAAWDHEENPLGVMNSDIPDISRLDISSLRRFDDMELTIASDVTHTLLGTKGAVHTFGPQKGIQRHDLDRFEHMLEHLFDKGRAAFGTDNRNRTGAGAAGGLGWMLMNFGAEPVPGGPLVAEMIGLEKEIADPDTDAVITGEGRSDDGTLEGKVPSVVAELAGKYDKPCHLISGQVACDFAEHFTSVSALAGPDISADEVMKDTEPYLRRKIRELFGA